MTEISFCYTADIDHTLGFEPTLCFHENLAQTPHGIGQYIVQDLFLPNDLKRNILTQKEHQGNNLNNSESSQVSFKME